VSEVSEIFEVSMRFNTLDIRLKLSGIYICMSAEVQAQDLTTKSEERPAIHVLGKFKA